MTGFLLLQSYGYLWEYLSQDCSFNNSIIWRVSRSGTAFGAIASPSPQANPSLWGWHPGKEFSVKSSKMLQIRACLHYTRCSWRWPLVRTVKWASFTIRMKCRLEHFRTDQALKASGLTGRGVEWKKGFGVTATVESPTNLWSKVSSIIHRCSNLRNTKHNHTWLLRFIPDSIIFRLSHCPEARYTK